jgi:hypothetical protein
LAIKIPFSSLKGITVMGVQFKKIALLSLLCCLFSLYLCPPTKAQGETDITTAIERARDVGVPEEVLSRILVLGYAHNVEAGEMADFIDIVRQVSEENLPAGLLVSKIEEGFSKRVQPRIIKRVLRQESSRYRFTRRIVYESMNRWGIPTENLTSGELVRLSKTLSMGISEQEMEGFFARAPQASIIELVNAVEFMAALKQSGLPSDIPEKIVFTGLRNRFFSKTAWDLALMVNSAKRKQIPDEKISAAALEMVMGRKNIREAHIDLGLDPQDMARGPQFSVSHPGAPEKGNGKGTTGPEGSGGPGGGKDGGKH